MDIKEFFESNNKVALAFSGGVASSYLLKVAIECGADITAYYVKSEFQSQAQQKAAIKIASSVRAKMKIVHLNSLAVASVAENGDNRCYQCKTNLLKSVVSVAKNDGYDLVIDGSTTTDLENADSVTKKANEELGIFSPLAEAGIDNKTVETLAKDYDIVKRTKPSYSCLATRINKNEQITADKLEIIEIVEEYLSDMGFINYRLRTVQDMAILEVSKNDAVMALGLREELIRQLSPFYSKVLLDLNYRQ